MSAPFLQALLIQGRFPSATASAPLERCIGQMNGCGAAAQGPYWKTAICTWEVGA